MFALPNTGRPYNDANDESPEGLSPSGFPEPYVNFSLHTAPDVLPLGNGFASSIGSSCHQLAHGQG
jgi:hypothetical protein